MPSLRFAPYREIASEIASRLLTRRQGLDPLAPWDEEVIVPSRGVAEAITAELLHQMPNGLAGLELQSLETLASRLLGSRGETPRVVSEAERRLAMRTAVRTIDDVVMTSRGISSMLERSHRDVRDSGFTVAQILRRVESERGLRNRRRTRLVLQAWTEYERRVGQLQAIDSAELLRRAARLAGPQVRPQLLAGFYDMTGAQWQLTEALLHAGRISGVWVPSEAPFAQPFVRLLAPFVEKNDALPGRSPNHGTTSVPALTVATYETGFEELRSVCSLVAGLIAHGTPANAIGIVARSLEPYDMRLLNRFANEQGFSTALAEEIPLSAHRIGRGALTLLRLRDRGFPRADVLGLVRDGLRAKTRLNPNVTDAETRRARIAGGTREQLQRMRTRSPVIEGYITLVAELEEMTATIDQQFLGRLGSLFHLETDADLRAAAKLDEVAALFRRAGAMTAADVMDAIEQATLPWQPADRNQTPVVWAGEIARFRGRSVDHLFAIRMQDEVFPQRRTEDPLLPDQDRILLGLRQIGDGRDEEQLLFSLLADSTSTQVHFSYATGDGFGKVLRPSRFVRNIPHSVLHTAHAVSEQQPRKRQLQLLAKSGTRSAFDGYIPGIDPSTLRLSPTQLEDFGECPQKFLFKHILGARDIDHPERELQIHHRDKGTLDHRILERFYRSLTDDELALAHAALPRLEAGLSERLDGFIDAQFDDHEGDVPPFNRTVRDIERRATKRILREFVVHDLADLEAQGLVPRWFEYRFGSKHRELADHPEPFVVDIAGVPVRVEGTIDRIDAGIGTYRIVDYKSGKALRHANLSDKIDRGVRLQLALYGMAVSEFFQAEAGNVSGTIKPLVIGEIKAHKFAFGLEEKRAALLETLAIFIRAIRTGAFPAFPNETDEFNSCKYCPVNHSCRTRHDLEERYAVLQRKDPRALLGEDG